MSPTPEDIAAIESALAKATAEEEQTQRPPLREVILGRLEMMEEHLLGPILQISALVSVISHRLNITGEEFLAEVDSLAAKLAGQAQDAEPATTGASAPDAKASEGEK